MKGGQNSPCPGLSYFLPPKTPLGLPMHVAPLPAGSILFLVRRHSTHCGMKPKFLLRIEGGTFLLVACVLYQHLHGSLLWFALLFFVPDVSMLGYLLEKRAGAIAYNLVHN